jgi:hypothetical protein
MNDSQRLCVADRLLTRLILGFLRHNKDTNRHHTRNTTYYCPYGSDLGALLLTRERSFFDCNAASSPFEALLKLDAAQNDMSMRSRLKLS